MYRDCINNLAPKTIHYMYKKDILYYLCCTHRNNTKKAIRFGINEYNIVGASIQTHTHNAYMYFI